MFRENAADLYPEEVKPWVASHPPTVKPVRQWKHKNFLDYAIQSQTELNKPDNLALEFRMFSKDVETLFECFVQFPQFVEEIPDWSLAKDLSVRFFHLALQRFTDVISISGLGTVSG